MDVVRKLIEYIYSKFKYCDVKFTDPVDQKEVIRNIFNAVIMPCFSLIIHLQNDILWNFIMVIYTILSHKDSCLTTEEHADVIFRIIYANAYLSCSVTTPLKASTKNKVILNGEEFLKKHDTSDACYVLQKLSASRGKDATGVRNKSNAYFFLLEQIINSHPSAVVDVDLSWLVKDLWPARIISISCDGEKIISGIEHALSSQFLSSDIALFLYEELDHESVMLKWSDGSEETFKLKQLNNQHYDPKPKKNYLHIFSKLLVFKYKHVIEDDAFSIKEWLLLIEIMMSHYIEDGTQYQFAVLDLACLLNVCYMEDKDAAINVYKGMWDIINGNMAGFISPVTEESLSIMTNWSTKDVLSCQFSCYLQSNQQEFAVKCMKILANRSDIEISLDSYWCCFRFLFESSTASSIDIWLNFMVTSLTSITSMSLKNKIEDFFLLIEIIGKQIESNARCHVDFITWFLQITFSTGSLQERSCLQFLKVVAESNIRNCEVDKLLSVVLNLIKHTLEKQEPVSGEVLYYSVKILNAILDNCHLCPSGNLAVQHVDSLLHTFSLINSFVNDEKVQFIPVQDLIKMCFESFMEVLVCVKVSVALDVLKKQRDLCQFFIQRVLSIPVKPSVLQMLFHLLLHSDVEETLLQVVHQMFNLIFESKVVINESFVAEFFSLCSNALLTGRSGGLHDVYREHIYDLVSGFTHKIFYIKEACVKSVCFVMQIDKDVRSRLLHIVSEGGVGSQKL